MQEDKNVKQKGFLKGMRSELKKVIWPTGEQTVKSTFATIAFVLLVSIILIVFNLFFNWLSNLWINSLSHEDVINNVVISGEKATEEGTESSEVVEDLPEGTVEEENLEEQPVTETIEEQTVESTEEVAGE